MTLCLITRNHSNRFPGRISQLLRKSFLCLLVIGFALSESAEKPNILLIVSDDMGYSDLGCYGGEIETPNLDRLAENGLRFTNFYVNNMCWPTRASLLTGLYPKTALARNGSADGGLHPKSTTLPQALKSAGYATYISGKWHLSSADEPDGPNAPQNRGFDRFYGTIHGASDFFAPADLQLDGTSMVSEWDNNPDYYYTDAIVDHALEFLRSGENDKPFFLYTAFTAAHWPLHAKPGDIEAYEGKYAMGWDELRRQRHARMKEMGVVDPDWKISPRNPEVPAWEDAEEKEWQQRRMEVYAAQITSMDENIGRLIRHLEETGELENTIVVYHHDNGGCHVEYEPDRTGSWTRDVTTDGKKDPIRPGNIPGLMPGPQTTFQSYGYGWANASNTPFRLFKQYDHEGGTRSPLIVSWPAGIDESRHGGLVGQVSHVVDLMPTLLDLAEVSQRNQTPMPFEGISLAGTISGNATELSRESPIFWAHNKGRAVRAGDWKLVSVGKGDWELYNLSVDGTELNDVAAKNPVKVAELTEAFRKWEKRTDLGAAREKKK